MEGGATTVYLYNVLGQLAAEYTDQSLSPSGTSYLTTDHLGSTRVVTDASQNIKSRRDYLPFGEEIPSNLSGRSSVPGYGVADGLRQRFTAKERDNESGLDYFLARYHSAPQGRFSSPDPENIGAIPRDPRSWNAYAYVWNNPVLYTDPPGEAVTICEHTTSTHCIDLPYDLDQLKRYFPSLIFEGGNVYAKNDDASRTLVGSYDVPLSDSALQIAKGVHGMVGSADSFAAALVINAATDAVLAPAIVGRVGTKLISLGLSRLPITKVFPALDRLSPKILRQMQTRGWTRAEIQEAFEKGQQVLFTGD